MRDEDKAKKQLIAELEKLRQEIAEAKENTHTLSHELMRTQEIARRSVASDLHNHVIQELSNLRIGLGNLMDDQLDMRDELKRRVSQESKAVEQLIATAREMAYSLYPAGLEEFGLVHNVRQYCKDFAKRNGLEFDLFSVGLEEMELDHDTMIALYRLIQEGLRNLSKHAEATHFTVRLSAPPGYIRLSIEDNGKGFDVAERLPEALREKHMGIWGMRQRVAYLRGQFEISSLPQQGTIVLIKIPYVEKTSG